MKRKALNQQFSRINPFFHVYASKLMSVCLHVVQPDGQKMECKLCKQQFLYSGHLKTAANLSVFQSSKGLVLVHQFTSFYFQKSYEYVDYSTFTLCLCTIHLDSWLKIGFNFSSPRLYLVYYNPKNNLFVTLLYS